MKALFVHDHLFYRSDNRVYSDKLPYSIWQRYLNHFDSITIFSRYSNETIDISKQPLSSGENVFFEFAPNISCLRAMFGKKKEQKKRLEKLILKHDVVIARLPSEYGLMAVELANKFNKKLVVEVVGCAWDALWNYGSLKAKIYAPILTYQMKKAVKNTDFISYVSQEFLQSRYSPPKRAIIVSVSNVEIPFLNEDILKKRLEKIELKNEKIVFGLIGSFKTKYKGIHNAIPVLGKLSNKYPNLEFRILGSGNPDEYIEMAKQYNIEDKVFFDGVLPSGEAVFKWLDNIDIYIHPSYTEGVPRALIESMSRGCPAIASTAGGIPELLDKNLTFNSGDENNFYEILEKNIFSVEWRIEQAKKNFEKSKEYQKNILDKRRFDFFEKVKNN
ncbi:glycosyltransferase [Aliarcobacter cryaerophilus]|uniref:glycosyltransferase family 4 protein n=1 Tax=Aliarcobacter cryaerophilus TaxID=28198 RepID=UPI0021B3C32D|nr:glycosyltransferase [Aliarcobacter cryaerophilus]MCT7523336.1 glycosyltransferase [Aliarcobacter cryaerophilus]